MMVACRQSTDFIVKGVINHADGQIVYLENVGLSSVVLMDSVKLNSSGQFNFKKPRPEYPDFYRLRLVNQLINFAIDSTETVIFNADAESFATSYTVEGSINSSAIKEITLAQLEANQEIKRARNELKAGNIQDSTYQQALLNAVDKYKKEALRHIYGMPMSTAAYFALFQKIDGLLFFDLYDKNDSRAFGAVATSLHTLYPNNQRAMHLYNLALQSIKANRSDGRIDVDVNEVDFLEIELPDISGAKIKLSEVAKGKVVILNFTVYQSDFSPNLNQRLDNLFSKYNTRGLEIFQVSLDSDLHLWKNVVSHLGWTCVHDPQSMNSKLVSLYNVQKLPALFLFDRKGSIVKRIEDVSVLDRDIQALL
jgi:peroxiredoxin